MTQSIDDRRLRCRFVDGPEDGNTFEMTGLVPISIGFGVDDQGRYFPVASEDGGYDIDWQWTSREARTATEAEFMAAVDLDLMSTDDQPSSMTPRHKRRWWQHH